MGPTGHDWSFMSFLGIECERAENIKRQKGK